MTRRLALFSFAAMLAGCAAPAPQHSGPVFCATVPPVGMILTELTRGRAEVVTLVTGGASPHTFEPRPSEARAASGALALFYVAEGLDAWAATLPAPHKVALLDLVPHDKLLPGEPGDAIHVEAGSHDHDHGEHDPHFWSDPQVVKQMLPAIAATLAQYDPEGKAVYEKNAQDFATRLDALDGAIAQELAPLRGKPVVTFHLSLQYFLRHYGLKLAAVVEPSPGKEATPRYIQDVVDAVKATGAKAVFREPQLPQRPAEAVAEAAGVPLAELDPYGGLPGRETYDALLRYNATALRKTLE